MLLWIVKLCDHVGNSSDPTNAGNQPNVGMPNFSSNLTGWGVGGLFNILACHNTNTNAQAAQYQYRWLASTMVG